MACSTSEGIDKAAFLGGIGHELRDSLGANGADGVRSKRLSFQISRAKKSFGMPWASAFASDQLADAIDGGGGFIG